MPEPLYDAAETMPREAATRPRKWRALLRYGLPAALLFATFCTTLLVGARLQFNFNHNLETFATGDELVPLFPVSWMWAAPRLLLGGVPFSLAIMSILLAHEMGHYLCLSLIHI